MNNHSYIKSTRVKIPVKLLIKAVVTLSCIAIITISTPLLGQREVPLYDWEEVENAAKGKTIYFYAWGGSEVINDYIKWAGTRVKDLYGITLKHVKIKDISQTVNKILAEKKAGNTAEGNVDLVWINGENFKNMKDNKLLYGPFTNALPNDKYLAKKQNITMTIDFSEPVEGMEAPWGMAKFVFIADSARVKKFPENILDLLAYAKKNPGQFTYPRPPNFHGTTFLKQALIEILSGSGQEVLRKPVASKQQFLAVTRPLWGYLDQLHPVLWKAGKTFPQNLDFQHQLLDEGEISITFSFNPNTAENRVLNNEFPKTVRTYVHFSGTIGNTHFLGIPFNAKNKEAALITINYLLSAEAQARKSNPKIWGDPTVLNIDILADEDQKHFSEIKRSKAVLSDADLGKTLLETHASWTDAIEKEWAARYSQ
ncbi:hypothetical protein COTS27_01560 [Spirochaetota bacterium]|nr:hypothetical protein COTS27_01560 [Spirochaetota bacterium]